MNELPPENVAKGNRVEPEPLSTPIKAGLIFACFFLLGPLIGFFALSVVLSAAGIVFFAPLSEIPLDYISLIWIGAIGLGGIQSYLVGLHAVRSFYELGYVSLLRIFKKAAGVGFFASLLLCMFVFNKSSAKELGSILLIVGAYLITHLVTASLAWIIVSPLQCRSEKGLMAS